MTDFALDNISGPNLSLQRARLYAPDGSTVADLALVGVLDPVTNETEFSGTVVISPTPADNQTIAYQYEVRQVATQDAAGFDASTTETIGRGDYGYLVGGAWFDNPFIAGYAGRYTNIGLCKIYRGGLNIVQWSSTDGTGTEDINAEVYAINVAEDRIDDDFAGSIYANPFVATGSPSSLTSTIPHWATVIATYEMYKKRGLDDADPRKNKLQQDYDQVLAEMQQYVGGMKRLRGVAYKSGATGAVQIVTPRGNNFSSGAGLVPAGQGSIWWPRW